MVKYLSEIFDVAFSALSDSIKRAIVERLTKDRATVKKLARPFRVALPAISKHLPILKQTGLRKRTKEGRAPHCELNATSLKVANGWLVALKVLVGTVRRTREILKFI